MTASLLEVGTPYPMPPRSPLRPIPARLAKRNICRLMARLSLLRSDLDRRIAANPGDPWDLELARYVDDELAYLRDAMRDPAGSIFPADWQGVV